MMLFLGAKWARKSKSEVTLLSKCLVASEKLWLLLCFVRKKINPQFFKNFSTALIVLSVVQAQLSLQALALAWLSSAQASQN